MCYSLCKDVGISENGEAYLTYGIKVFCKEGVKLIEDVSTDYYFVKSIVDRFTKFKLSIFYQTIFHSIFKILCSIRNLFVLLPYHCFLIFII